MWILLLLIVNVTFGQLCPDSPPTTPPSLSVTLYSYGTANTQAYAHLLSSDPSITTIAAQNGVTLKTEYTLSGVTLSGAVADCPLSCLYALQPVYFSNSTVNQVAMARPGDQYPDMSNAPFSKIYCAIANKACGATIPLYVYYSSTNLDYYVSTAEGGPSANATAYPLASIAPSLTPGTALCYIWTSPTTTTVATNGTTATSNTTTTVAPGNSTTTQAVNVTTVAGSNSTTASANTTTTMSESNSTTTTVKGDNSTTLAPNATTVDGGNGTTTTSKTNSTTTLSGSNSTTVSSNSTQSTQSTTVSSGGNSTTISIYDKIKSSSWWKWALIILGGILFAGIIIGLLGFLTVYFINPAPIKRRTVSPYSPHSQQVLPPRPVYSGPSPQPLTVGPMGGYPPGM